MPPLNVSHGTTTAPSGVAHVIKADGTARGIATINDRLVGVRVVMTDGAGVADRTVTGATDASPIVISTSASHGYVTGEDVVVWGVGGNTAANDNWTITVLSSTTFSLDGSSGNGAYTSGGKVTNRPMMTALAATVTPTVKRGGLTSPSANADDVNGLVVYNAGAVKATDGIYIAANQAISGVAWDSGITVAAPAYKGINLNKAFDVGIDLSKGTYTTAPIRLPGNAVIVAGTGSPEGVVTAPVGSLYLRTDGGAGSTLYVKESDTGDTGWVGK